MKDEHDEHGAQDRSTRQWRRRDFLATTTAGLLAPAALGCSSSPSRSDAGSDAGADADAAPVVDAPAAADAPLGSDAAPVSDAASPPPGQVGWDPQHDAGTSGDYYVDGSVATSGDGTTVATAFKTINEALTSARSDGAPRTIKVLKGVYREALSLDKFQGTLSGYGKDKPVITGAEVLGGWTACTAADQVVVGANYASIYKATLPAAVQTGPRGLNLYEAGAPLRLAQDRKGAVDLFFITYDEDFHQADSFGLDSANKVSSITDKSVLSKYSAAQLSNAFVFLYHKPNTVSQVNITAVDTSAHSISVDGAKTVQSATSATEWRYSLANILPAMKQGQWGYTGGGGATITVYCWPNKVADLTDQIEYSARTHCVDVPPGMAGPVTLEGLDLRQAGGTTSKEAVCVGTVSGSLTKKKDLTLRHVRAGKVQNVGGGYGAIYLCNVDDCTVEHVTVEDCSGSFGVFLQGGGSSGGGMQRARLTAYHGRYISGAAARFYGQNQVEFSRSLLEDCGYGAHTNQFNFYEQCDRCLVYAVRSRRCIGYATFQEASRLFYGFCELNGSEDGRVLVDQQNATPGPQTSCDNRVWNCSFLPHPDHLSAANAVNLGDKDYPSIRWHLHNCVVHGGGMSPAYVDGAPSVEGSREGNIYTGAAYWNASKYGWSLKASEVEASLAAVYTDAATADFSPVAGSVLLTHQGVDISAAIAAAKVHFPSFDFSKDLEGDPITIAKPGCGPRGDPTKWAP